MEFTLQEVKDKEAQLRELESAIEQVSQELQDARAEGDLKENAEYQAAYEKLVQLGARKTQLEEQLSDYKIIKPDTGPRIAIGNYVQFYKIDANHNPISEARTIRLAEEGNTIDKDMTKLTLSIESPLGKAILNGTDGVYTIQTTGGVVYYHVTKVMSI